MIVTGRQVWVDEALRYQVLYHLGMKDLFTLSLRPLQEVMTAVLEIYPVRVFIE